MRYADCVYGKFEITEPVLIELINRPSLQRLKGIDVAGYKPLWVKPKTKVRKYAHSRFAHSLGVCYLLRKYGASLEEQIAGLIHDASHSAFSHCVDYVFDSGSEKEHTHQDNVFEKYILKTEIPAVLKKYGFNIACILDDNLFPLKERKLPDLCADRIDYSLKTAVIFGEINASEKDFLLNNLTAQNGAWVFKSLESARKYAELFLKLNTIYYAGFKSAVMFRTVGDCLRYALEKRYISEKDLYTNDKTVLGIIKKEAWKDRNLKRLYDRMSGRVTVWRDPVGYDAAVFCKSRIVDPLFMNESKISRLSFADARWGKTVKKELKPKRYFLKFER